MEEPMNGLGLDIRFFLFSIITVWNSARPFIGEIWSKTREGIKEFPEFTHGSPAGLISKAVIFLLLNILKKAFTPFYDILKLKNFILKDQIEWK